MTVYGDFATGYIVTPTLPPDLTPAPPEPTPGVVGDAVARYAERRPALIDTTEHYLTLVTRLLDDAGINYLSVTARTKSVASFAAKADRSVDGRRLYTDPSTQITDQVGCGSSPTCGTTSPRSATCSLTRLHVLDDLDMGQETAREGRWGYASRHLLVAVEGESQPASVQVRTVLQHAWAEFEHDIRYKGTIPEEDAPELDRRFTLAAGLLELADREFTDDPRPATRRRWPKTARRQRPASPESRPPCWPPTSGTAFPTPAGLEPSTTRGSPGCWASWAS